tara:strand:- start:8 stop:310 length:303 start_codon:yes stop_codon:yes gene_type:complete
LGSFPGFLAKTKGKLKSLAMVPAKIKPLLSMLATISAPKSLAIFVNSSHVFTNASGVSIRLVISRKEIPSIGKLSTVLINFLRFKGSLILNILPIWFSFF